MVYHMCWYCLWISAISLIITLSLYPYSPRDLYTQSLLIRNGGKFWLVAFLILWLFLHRLCFLFFSWFCIVVSYFFLDFLRSFLIFFKNFDTSHMYVVWGGKPYKMKKPMRWKTSYFSKSSNSPLSLYNYV